MHRINVCGFLFNGTKLLIAKRSKQETFIPGLWEMIGGGVELGESLKNALKREFKEELKLDIKVAQPYHTSTYTCNENAAITYEVEVDFLAYLNDSNQVVKINKKIHTEYKWVVEDEALKLFLQNHPANQLEAVKKGFALFKEDNK